MKELVLVTGAAGYIGSVLVRQLLAAGHHVRGFDNLSFGGEALLGIFNHPQFEFRKGDMRDSAAVAQALDGATAVVHLAAIVGDPACAAAPDAAQAINWDASKSLFDAANAGPSVRRFVFASTCSNYGKMPGDAYLDERSPLRPVSLYAELKVRMEQYLTGAPPRSGIAATALRFSTVYGLSPRMRFDLTVNEFTREVAKGKVLRIFGERFWRPYCHVEDLAGSCMLVLRSPEASISGEVFNVGDTEENYQKAMLAEEILKVVPGAQIEYVTKTEDPRDYRVDFSKIRDNLGFRITRKVPDGIREIYRVLADGIITDPYSKSYQNI